MAKKYNRKPLPEFDRAIIDVVAAIKGISASEIMRRTKGQVSDRTVNNLRKGPKNGGTKWPRHYTLTRILNSVGMKFVTTEIDTRLGHNSKNKEFRINA